LTGYLAKPLVFLEFWLGVKKFAKFGLFIAFFLTKFLPNTLNFQKICVLFSKKTSEIGYFFQKSPSFA
jgi:hypothetical protein